tara:strand:- start:13662 stop:13859 length:198 start_codon:yes stop_codon:yes gene_type:complete
MTYLTDEYRQFMNKVQRDRPDNYTNSDPETALLEHYNMDPEFAKLVYYEWIKEVFVNMPWKPADD